MNRLSIEKRVQLVSLLIEGNSVRATSRISGVAFATCIKFVEAVEKLRDLFG